MNARILDGIAVVLLMLIPIQALTSIRLKSATVEEGVHLAAGVYCLKTGDIEAFPGYPPAGRLLMGLIPSFGARLPIDDPEIHREMYPFAYGSRFLYEVNDADRILFMARATVVGVSVLLGLWVWRVIWHFSGAGAALIALFGYVFCPNLLAHGRLATLDLILSAWVFMALWSYRRASLDGRPVSYLVAALFTFLAVDTKYSGWLLFPMFGCFHAIRYGVSRSADAGVRRSMGLFFFVLAVSLLLINVQHGFKGSFISLKQYEENPSRPANTATSDLVRTLSGMPVISRLPLPFPETYIRGWDLTVRADRDEHHPNWFRGRLYTKGERFWDYYLLALGLKMPVPFLLGIFFWIGYGGYLAKKRRFQELEPHLFLMMPLCVFFVFYSFVCHSQLGLRLILPGFAFVFCGLGLCGAAVFSEKKYGSAKRRWRFMVPAGLLAIWYLGSSAAVYPHYLSYFNELAGGPENGIAYFADANLDWGQDLKGLKRYMDEKGIRQIHLVYYGPNGQPELDYYGIHPADPQEGMDAPWAISATWHYYAEIAPFKSEIPFDFKRRRPDGRIGYSIHVYEGVRR